jgi:hypothetical protein
MLNSFAVLFLWPGIHSSSEELSLLEEASEMKRLSKFCKSSCFLIASSLWGTDMQLLPHKTLDTATVYVACDMSTLSNLAEALLSSQRRSNVQHPGPAKHTQQIVRWVPLKHSFFVGIRWMGLEPSTTKMQHTYATKEFGGQNLNCRALK